jgi:RNA polymerase sigma-70 factor (ECF subfamily)
VTSLPSITTPSDYNPALWSNPGRDTTDARFERLFREHQRGLHGFLLRRLQSSEDAEDALVQTFAQAWRARDSFRGETTDKKWLYGIAGRVAIDLIRARRPSVPVSQLESTINLETAGPTGDDPMDTVLDTERRALVRRAVERLPEIHRRLVDLYYFQGCRHEEISALTGIPSTNVRGQLHRIRKLLQQRLANDFGPRCLS